MTSVHRISIALIAVLWLTGNGRATDRAGVAAASTDGVHVEMRNAADRAVFCFKTDAGYKIAAGYGIEFDASIKDKTFWAEPMPKLFSDDNLDYFHLPLRVDLSGHGDVGGHSVHVKLGACHLKECRMYDFDLVGPGDTQPAQALACPQ